MNYTIEYWANKEKDPMEFLKHFRCTTEPIGGSTEFSDDGKLVDWDAAVVAIKLAKNQYKELLEKTALRLRNIADTTYHITSGNISHEIPGLRGHALRGAEIIEKNLNEQ